MSTVCRPQVFFTAADLHGRDMPTELEYLIQANGGMILGRGQPHTMARRLRRLVAAQELASPLPGVFIPADLATDPPTLAKAVQAYYPNAVLAGAIAARLTYWPTLGVPHLSVLQRRDPPRIGPYRFSRRRVPPDLIYEIDGLRVQAPALTALELAEQSDGESIDRALRDRVATIASMRAALKESPHRPGNADSTRWLLDSRDEPWSRAEREAHRLLRAWGITGWRANHEVHCRGVRYFIDVAFPRKRIAMEVDSREFHSSHEAFEADRRRLTALRRTHWRILQVTWAMLTEDPDYVREELSYLLDG